MPTRRTLSPGYRFGIVLAALLVLTPPPQAVMAAQSAEDAIQWKDWPKDYPSFDYSEKELEQSWDALHRRDQVPFPDADFVRRVSDGPVADPAAVAAALRKGWRRFHGGHFEDAYRIGRAQGAAGLFLAGRAKLDYAVNIIDEIDARRRALHDLVEEIASGTENMHRKPFYWELTGLAIIYGQYGRTLSTAQAVNADISDKIQHYLKKSLAESDFQPAAHALYGAYNADIVDRLGGMMARMFYGASRKRAVAQFEKAIKQAPELIQVRVEYAHSLLQLWGKDRADKAIALLNKALSIKPKDAEDYLEQLRARKLLKQWRSEHGGESE